MSGYTYKVEENAGNGRVICNGCGETIYATTGVESVDDVWSRYMNATTGDFSCPCTRGERQPTPTDDPEHVAAFLSDVRAAGVAAGSWVIDGNTGEDAARRLLEGIDDGDPEVYDSLPGSQWGGEWAGDPTYDQLAQEAGLSQDEADDAYPEALAAFSQGVVDEVTRAARALLGLDEARA